MALYEAVMKHILLAVICGAVVACSTYSKRECEQMNWTTEASRLAREGQTLTEIRDVFAESCQADHGIAADEAAVEAGFKQGLNALCTPEGGERLARDGNIYKGTCAGLREAEFLSKYHTVREAHLEREVRDMESKVRSLEIEKDRLESQVRGLESDLNSCRASH